MTLYYFLFRKPCVVDHVLHIGAKFAAIAYGDYYDQPTLGDLSFGVRC